MIYIGNLILRTMIFEYFNNSQYFKRYGLLFSKISLCTMVQKQLKKEKKFKNFSNVISARYYHRFFTLKKTVIPGTKSGVFRYSS